MAVDADVTLSPNGGGNFAATDRIQKSVTTDTTPVVSVLDGYTYTVLAADAKGVTFDKLEKITSVTLTQINDATALRNLKASDVTTSTTGFSNNASAATSITADPFNDMIASGAAGDYIYTVELTLDAGYYVDADDFTVTLNVADTNVTVDEDSIAVDGNNVTFEITIAVAAD